jgi:hypothetical protein
MDTRTESRLLGLLSVALAIFGVVSPYRWHDMPEIITNGALVIAAFLGFWAGWLVLPNRLRFWIVTKMSLLLPRNPFMAPFLVIVAGLVIAIAGSVWVFVWPTNCGRQWPLN